MDLAEQSPLKAVHFTGVLEHYEAFGDRWGDFSEAQFLKATLSLLADRGVVCSTAREEGGGLDHDDPDAGDEDDDASPYAEGFCKDLFAALDVDLFEPTFNLNYKRKGDG